MLRQGADVGSGRLVPDQLEETGVWSINLILLFSKMSNVKCPDKCPGIRACPDTARMSGFHIDRVAQEKKRERECLGAPGGMVTVPTNAQGKFRKIFFLKGGRPSGAIKRRRG